MKGKSVTNSIIVLFFSVILAFLLLPTISAKAAVGDAISPSDFNDGLSNWSNIKITRMESYLLVVLLS